MMFINEASDDPTNLPAHIREHCLKNRRPMFDKAIGSEHADNQYNGAINADEFFCVFRNWLAELPQPDPHRSVACRRTRRAGPRTGWCPAGSRRASGVS
ncbi:hypothetical protein [Dactylosporangium sp. NPDC006015]|uniref:hypothetical protein n=1 Tax=Dactylosporangium sp. NPDC006015 TaxID=3154576 RepID=UPI0033B8D1F5